MSVSCPNMSSPEWKVLVGITKDKDAATKIWLERGQTLDGIERRSVIEQAIGLDKYNPADRNLPELMARLDSYNEKNNTSHKLKAGALGKAVFEVNYDARRVGQLKEVTGSNRLKDIKEDTDGGLIVDGRKLSKEESDSLRNILGMAPELPNLDFDKLMDESESSVFDLADKEVFDEFVGDYADTELTVDGDVDTVGKAIKSGMKRLLDMQRNLERALAGADSDKAEVLREKIDHIGQLLSKRQEKAALMQMYDVIHEELLSKAAQHAKDFHDNPDNFGYSDWLDLQNNIILAESINEDLSYVAEISKDPETGKAFAKDPDFDAASDKASKDISKAKKFLRRMDESFVEKFGNDHALTADQINNLKENIDYDTSFIGRWVTPLRALKDPTANVVYNLVNSAKTDSHTYVYEHVGKLRNAYENMINSGFKDTKAFYELDDNGVPTGYISSDYKWGEYYAKEEAMIEKVNEIADRKGSSRRPPNSEILNLSKDKQKQIKDIYKKFRKENMIKKGKFYEPNPAKNTEHAANMKNPAYAEFHKAMMENIDNIHDNKMLPPSYGANPKYRFRAPQIRKTTMQTLTKSNSLLQGLKTAGRDVLMDAGLSKDTTDTDYIQDSSDTSKVDDDIILDVNGNPAKITPVHYTKKLDNMTDLSTDIMSGMAVYTEMASNFFHMNSIVPELSFIQHRMMERKIKAGKFGDKIKAGNESATYAAVRDFIDANVYGKVSADPTIVNVAGREINLDKATKKFIDYARKVNLFMNIPTAVSGHIKGGIIDAKVDDWAGHRTSQESANKASLELWKNMPDMVAEAGARFKKNPLNQLVERMGIDKSIREQYKNMDIETRAGRVDSSDLIYGIYSVPDFKVKTKLMLSMMDNTRIVDGEVLNKRQFKVKHPDKKWSDYQDMALRNAYESSDGIMKVKDSFATMGFKDFKNFNEVENALKRTLDLEAAKYSGTVTSLDRTALGRRLAGTAVMMHRNWMVSGLVDRLQADQTDPLTGEKIIGSYRGTTRYMKNTLKDIGQSKEFIKSFSQNWDKLTQPEKVAVYKTALDAGFALLTYGLARLAQEAFDDEPEDSHMAHYTAYQMNRLFMEQSAFLNPKSIIDLLNSPTAMTNWTASIGDVFDIFSLDDLESGPYEGFTKAERAIIKKSMMKNIYEMSEMKNKNRYFQSQVMN